MSWFQTISELAHATCGAQTVEVCVESSDPIEYRWSAGEDRPTGYSTTEWMDSVLLSSIEEGDSSKLADWVRSAAIVPLTNASADLGWMIIASDTPGAFTTETLLQLLRCSSLIEAQLDAELQNSELISLSERLYQSESALTETRSQLEVSNRELEQFAYIAAHELVAPLRSVAVYAEVLATITTGSDHGSPDEVTEVVDNIRDGVQRMTEQVQYLLTLSRAEQASPTNLDLVDTTRTVYGAIDTLTELYADAGATITVDPLPAVLAQDIPLQSVFANLLTNAVRYSDPSRPLEVHIRAAHETNQVNIEVADNGIGISPEAQQRIFGLFERDTTDGDGLGVGLAVSRRILEGFGASISVTSGYRGSTFVLHFPRPGSQRRALHAVS